MSLADVLELLDIADEVGVPLWMDGGWGVDAVLGRQTREHEDLDIVIERRHERAFAEALRQRGFTIVDRPDTRRWNYVLGDSSGRQVDFHVIERRPDGDWDYGPAGSPPEDVVSAHALTGRGVIGRREVSCVTPEAQVRYHTGYAVDAKDWADVQALCIQFGIAIPPDFDRFQGDQ